MPRKLTAFLFAVLACLYVQSAQAGSVDRVEFGIPAMVKTQLLSQEPGLSRYRVASNSGFTVHGLNVIGDVEVDLNAQGSAAQLPGPSEAEIFLTGANAIIYRAERKTAKRPGTLRNQSVVIEIRYSDVATSPEFIFKPAG